MSMGWSLSSNTKEISCVQSVKCQVRERRMHSTGEASPWSHCLCLRRSTCQWWFWELGSAPRSPPDQNVSPTTTSWPGSPRTWTGKQESVCGRIIFTEAAFVWETTARVWRLRWFSENRFSVTAASWGRLLKTPISFHDKWTIVYLFRYMHAQQVCLGCECPCCEL